MYHQGLIELAMGILAEIATGAPCTLEATVKLGPLAAVLSTPTKSPVNLCCAPSYLTVVSRNFYMLNCSVVADASYSLSISYVSIPILTWVLCWWVQSVTSLASTSLLWEGVYHFVKKRSSTTYMTAVERNWLAFPKNHWQQLLTCRKKTILKLWPLLYHNSIMHSNDFTICSRLYDCLRLQLGLATEIG